MIVARLRALPATLRRHPLRCLAVLLLLAALAGAHLWARAQLQAARDALAAENIEEARRHLRLCQRIWWRSPEAHLLAARVERTAGNYEGAEAELNTYKRLAGGESEAFQLEWVLLRAQWGEVDEVASGLWACVEQGHPDRVEILRTLARRYLAELRLPQASSALDRWLREQPDSATAHEWKGWVAERQKLREGARQHYEKAVELDPDRTSVRLNLVELYLDRNAPAEAQRHLAELSKRMPDDPRVLVGLARCAITANAYEDADELLTRAQAAQPDALPTLLTWARLELERGRPAEAERWLRRAEAHHPNDVDVLFNLSRALGGMERKEEAAAYLKRHQEALRALDRIQQLLQQPSATFEARPELAAELGSLLLGIGEERPGVYWLQKAVQAAPRNATAHRALADYFQKAGEPDRAARHRLLAAEAERQTP